MSLFSDFLRSISGSAGLYDAAAASQARASSAFDLAFAEQTDATRRARLAAIPAIDKESTVVAGEQRLRAMLKAAGFRFGGAPMGDAPVGFTTAFGE